MQHFLNLLLKLSVLILFITSCGNSAKQEEIDASDVETNIAQTDSQNISAQNVFNTIPSRQTILELTAQAKSEYDPSILSNPDDVSKYSLESARALNLGIYGADLNVASIYDQTQESMLYFKCVNILAKTVGVANSFDEKMGDRMTANQSNRDSTLSIITQAFKSADLTLRKNNRVGISSLLVAGAWIEGLYVACQTAKSTNSEGIVKEIFNQKESLTNLLELLTSSNIPEDTKYIQTVLTEIKQILEKKTDAVFSIESIKEIDTKITELRKTVIASK